MSNYNIKYELDGGMASNPTSYTENDEVKLRMPMRPGFRFAGWQGATALIPKGSHGDRTFTAAWKNIELSKGGVLLRGANFGADNGLESLVHPTPVSTPIRKGQRGENVYEVRTVYTDIKVDGIKDPAYDYGVHIKSDVSNAPDYYKDNNTGFDAYVIRGQDGRAYIFVEVVDPDIYVTDELWKKNIHHCDGIHFYSEQGLTLIPADPIGRKIRSNVPCEYKVVKTDVGYNVEFAILNGGSPFGNDDAFGFSFFMCDCVSYESADVHTKYVIRASSELSGKEKYHGPQLLENDTLLFSVKSASGKELVDDTAGLERSGDVVADIISGAARSAFVLGVDSSAYTVCSTRLVSAHFNSFCHPIATVKSNSDLLSKYNARIVIGMTDDPESVALSDIVPYNGYGMKITENAIYLIGWREEALDKALGMLVTVFDHVRNGGKISDFDSLYMGSFGSIPGANIPRIDGIRTVTDVGDGAYCILVQPAKAETYEDYKKKLESAGFELYTTNKMNTVLFATYYDDTAVVNVSYDTNAENGNDLRIVVEPKCMTSLPVAVAEEYTPKCKSSITQICPNRMTYVVKLDNGEFLVADSGTNKQHSYIYDELMRLSDDGKPVVAVWTFSHFHQDHNGGFVEFVQNEEYMKNVTVKSVIYNTPEQQLLTLASKLDQKNMAKWESLLDRHGIKRYQARTGQKYRFANAELELLYTYEDLMPFFVYIDRSNPSSFVYSMKIEGQRFIITGDCCAEASRLMVARYGDTLKSDFVQLPHHGHGDGGTSPEFYKRVNADYVLWPGEPARLSPAERMAKDMAKKYFVMCEGTVTLDIPYKG